MRSRFLAALSCVLFLIPLAGCGRGSGTQPQEETDLPARAVDELKQLEGTWAPVSVKVGTLTLPIGEDPDEDTFRLIIRGETYTLTEPDDRGVTRASIRIDPSANPKAIDVAHFEGKNAGKTELGIYELSGDSFRICYARPGEARPAEVSLQPTGEQVLYTYRRLKPDDVAKERAKKEATEKDMSLLEGTWEEVSRVEDDRRSDRPEGKRLRLTVRGKGAYAVERGGQELGTGTLTLYPTRDPKSLMVRTEKGFAYMGLYKLGADELRVGLSNSFSPEFAPDSGNAKSILLIFRKGKPKP